MTSAPEQLCLLLWADKQSSNVIDLMPALIRKAAVETIYRIPRPKGCGDLIQLQRGVA